MSVRNIRKTDQMNTHSNIKNPARVSCSTNPCIWRPFRPGAAPPAPVTPSTSATSRYLGGRRRGRSTAALSRMRSVNANDDLRVAQADHVAVGQLELLDRCVIDGGAVGRVEVGEERELPIPADLQVTARHTGVRQPELRILPAPHDVGALAQLVSPAAAVVKLQGDRGPRGPIAALAVVAVTRAGLLGVVGPLVFVVTVDGFGGVPAALRGVSRTRNAFGVLGVVARAVLLAVAATLLITLVVPAALVGIRRPLLFGRALRGGRSVGALVLAGRPA